MGPPVPVTAKVRTTPQRPVPFSHPVSSSYPATTVLIACTRWPTCRRRRWGRPPRDYCTTVPLYRSAATVLIAWGTRWPGRTCRRRRWGRPPPPIGSLRAFWAWAAWRTRSNTATTPRRTPRTANKTNK
eukprot:1189315-Prorocentrum_minimum.AAC.4